MKRVPADWEPQQAIWIAWPHNEKTWPGRFQFIPSGFLQLVNTLSESTQVNLLASQSPDRSGLDRSLLAGLASSVRLHDVDTNDCWIRDYGPTYVVGDHVAGCYAIDWKYNAWGGKYPPWQQDDAATAAIIQEAGWQRLQADLCLEGGALEFDGTGRLLTTSNCVLTRTRNPGWTRRQVERRLGELTGVHEVVWVDGGGLQGDDTDGHIDQLARFLDPENLVIAVCDDPEDENHIGLEQNVDLLSRWAEDTSPAVNVHRLPIPPAARFVQGQRVPESYCNFLRLGPERILVPCFGQPGADQRAIETIQAVAAIENPNVSVTGFDCVELVWGLGALLCAPSNQPMLPVQPDHPSL